MNEKKSLVEEALIQMKNVEEAIAENAKGILASTMKEEISQLVKESLSEQEDVEKDAETDDVDADNADDTDVDDTDVDDTDGEEDDMDDTDVDDTDVDDTDIDDTDIDDTDMDDTDVDDAAPIDLTGASDEEILKVFKAMGEDDGIIVKKDGGDIHLTDDGSDTEYLIKLGESTVLDNPIDEDMVDIDDVNSITDQIFTDNQDLEESEPMEEQMYEIDFDGMGDEDDDYGYGPRDRRPYDDDEEEEEEEGLVYELELDKDFMPTEDYKEFGEQEEDGEDVDDHEGREMQDYLSMNETYNPKKSKRGISPKGRIGKGPKFSYEKTTGGFSEKMKQGPKSIGTGKAKFEYKKGANLDGKSKLVKKTETKEAARTYGMGSKEGRGLRKGITPNRNLKLEALESEVSILRQKNEEYRKALNVFREKLNEVAIFNSNLAYATRLFTEHSTTKKEKINILRRFDGVETLKESKTLYKSIKDELGKSETKSINETVDKKINKTVSTGSSTTLIESKTYENPQFMRMKDLMSKIK